MVAQGRAPAAAALLATTLFAAWVALGSTARSGEAANPVVAVGDSWFCEVSYLSGVCPTTVSVGDTVTWVYPAGSASVHTVTDCGATCDAPTSSPLFDSGIMFPAASFSRTFDQEGTLRYYCKLHPIEMRGTITVQAAAPAPAPTDTPGQAPTLAATATAGPATTAAPAPTPTAGATTDGRPSSTPAAAAADPTRTPSVSSPTPGVRMASPAASPAAAGAAVSGREGSSGGSGGSVPVALIIGPIAGVGLLGAAGLVAARWRVRRRA